MPARDGLRPGRACSTPRQGPCLTDFVFLLCAALYAWLALDGVELTTAGGARMDSDLATYAQGMAQSLHPGLFASDPVLNSVSPANSIHTIERMLGAWLTPGDSAPTGLFRAGALAVFCFYAGWYGLGRWLYGAPRLGALLAVSVGITFWVGWGTFWGIGHSQPIPRVFFAACMPFLLWLFLLGMNRAALRPAAMLMTGLAMWVHGVSALNCGAMFFMAYLLCRSPGAGPARHLGICLLCLAAFLAPVLLFLWPSLGQARSFSAEELAIFQEMFSLRWAEDFAGLGQRLRVFFLSPNPVIILAGFGICAWLVSLPRAAGREKQLLRACPAFVLALGCVVAVCWLETSYAPSLGRLPMGHELVRGLRFLVPLSFLCIVCALHLYLSATVQRILLAVIIGGVLILSAETQYMAAQYSLAQRLPARLAAALPLAAEGEKLRAEALEHKKTLEAVAAVVPQGEAIYDTREDMALRYMAMRPLAHAFKDGYVFFYNKDFPGSARWLRLEKIKAGEGPLKAWLASGAPWLLAWGDVPGAASCGSVAAEGPGWRLIRRGGEAGNGL